MINVKTGGGFVSNHEWHKMTKARITHAAEPDITDTEPVLPKAIAYTHTRHLAEAAAAVPVYYKTRRATHRLPAGSWVPLVSKPNYCRRVTP